MRWPASFPTWRRWPGGSPSVDYLVDEGLATSIFLSLRLPQPLLLEGEAGRRQDGGGKVAGDGARHAADPPAVL